MIDQLRSTVRLAEAREWSEIRGMMKTCWRSESSTVGLRRDLSVPFTAARAAIPIIVRPLKSDDLLILFGSRDESLTGEALRQRFVRLRMAKASLATCYVAANEADEPCYVQWLVGPDENDKIRTLFGDRFPALKSDEMLLEGAFTLEAWRGKGIMGAAMAEIAAKGSEHGARRVITFVASDNTPSLKGCKKSGFEPYLARADHWRRFHHTSRFSPLPVASSEADVD